MLLEYYNLYEASKLLYTNSILLSKQSNICIGVEVEKS